MFAGVRAPEYDRMYVSTDVSIYSICEIGII